MGWLITLHRVVFDRSLLAEAATVRMWWAVRQSLVWFIVCVAVSSLAHAWYVTHEGHAFARLGGQLMSGCTISAGRLSADSTVVLVPPVSTVSGAITALLPGLRDFSGAINDSLFVIDTSAVLPSAYPDHPYLRATSDSLVLRSPLGTGAVNYGVAWRDLFGSSDVRITQTAISRALRAQYPALVALYVQWNAVMVLFRLVWAFPFLLMAAYILNVTLTGTLRTAFVRAILVTVPLLAGLALEALAGVDMVETWYVLVSAGFFVLFRAGRVVPSRGEGRTGQDNGGV